MSDYDGIRSQQSLIICYVHVSVLEAGFVHSVFVYTCLVGSESHVYCLNKSWKEREES